jgi:hypothetical protein
MYRDVDGCGTMTRFSASRGILYSAPPAPDEPDDEPAATGTAEATADD